MQYDLPYSAYHQAYCPWTLSFPSCLYLIKSERLYIQEHYQAAQFRVSFRIFINGRGGGAKVMTAELRGGKEYMYPRNLLEI